MKYVSGSDGIFHYIPGELSYDHFDKSGKISMWRLAQLIEGCRSAFVQHGPPAKWKNKPFLFVRSHFFEIHPPFYNIRYEQAPPLKMINYMSYIGKTSFCLDAQVKDLTTNELFVTNSTQCVLVSKETRRPTSFPLTARKLAIIIPTRDKRPVFDPEFPAPPSGFFTQKRIVMPSDTDINQHLNQASFVHYCLDCVGMAALGGALPSFSSDVIYSYVKSLWIGYAREARVGEELSLSCWEDKDLKYTIWVEVKCDSEVASRCQIQFYADFPKGSVLDQKESTTAASKL